MDELVLCTIQKKKHCAQKKQRKTTQKEGEEEVDQEDCSGNDQNKGMRVGREGKDQETSHVGGSGENKSSRVGGSNNKKGRPAVVGNKRRGRSKILAQEQEAAPQPEQMEVTLGSEFVNTDPHVNRSNCSVGTSSTLPMSYQVMMPFPSAGSTHISHNVHPNHVTHHNLSQQPMDLLTLPRPTLQEHFPYEQPYFNPQQYMQHNIMAPPGVYTQGTGLGYSIYGQWQPPLWDQHGLP
jgi:hypothetical protein